MATVAACRHECRQCVGLVSAHRSARSRSVRHCCRNSGRHPCGNRHATWTVVVHRVLYESAFVVHTRLPRPIAFASAARARGSIRVSVLPSDYVPVFAAHASAVLIGRGLRRLLGRTGFARDYPERSPAAEGAGLNHFAIWCSCVFVVGNWIGFSNALASSKGGSSPAAFLVPGNLLESVFVNLFGAGRAPFASAIANGMIYALLVCGVRGTVSCASRWRARHKSQAPKIASTIESHCEVSSGPPQRLPCSWFRKNSTVKRTDE